MGDSPNIEFTNLRLEESGVTAEEMVHAGALCEQALTDVLPTPQAILHLRWNPEVPGLTDEVIDRLEEELRFELGLAGSHLHQDTSLEYPGAVLIGIDPGERVSAEKLDAVSRAIVAIASRFLRVAGSSIE